MNHSQSILISRCGSLRAKCCHQICTQSHFNTHFSCASGVAFSIALTAPCRKSHCPCPAGSQYCVVCGWWSLMVRLLKKDVLLSVIFCERTELWCAQSSPAHIYFAAEGCSAYARQFVYIYIYFFVRAEYLYPAVQHARWSHSGLPVKYLTQQPNPQGTHQQTLKI